MAQKTLQERTKETIYPNSVGAITAEKEQALLIDFADVIDKKANKSDIPDGVYIGETEPTDEKVKVWINPNEEANTIQARTSGGTSGVQTPIVWLQELMGEQPTESQLADNVRAYNALVNRKTYTIEALLMMNDEGENGWGLDRYLVGGIVCLPTSNVVQIMLITGYSEEAADVMPFYLYPNGSISLEAIEQ